MTPIWKEKPRRAPSSTPEAPPAPSSRSPNLQETFPVLAYSAELVTNCGGGGTLRWRDLRPDELTCGGISNGVDFSVNGHQCDTYRPPGDGGCGNSDSNPAVNDRAGGPSDGSQWPKVRMGRTALERLLADLPDGTSDTELANKLFELLTWVNDSYIASHLLLILINFTNINYQIRLWNGYYWRPLLHDLLDGWAGRRDPASFHQPLPPHSFSLPASYSICFVSVKEYILLPSRSRTKTIEADTCCRPFTNFDSLFNPLS